MSETRPVLVPLINPNETEARVVDIHVNEGQQVQPGDLLATLETTKSTFELTAENAGYIAGLQATPGELMRAGELFAYLADHPNWQAPKVSETEKVSDRGVPEGLRITQPALSLAQQEGIDLGRLPIGPIVTEDQIKAALAKASKVPALKIPKAANQPNALIVFGGGGHGKAVIELLQAVGGFSLVGIVDDGLEAGTEVLGVPVIGNAVAALAPLREAGCQLAVNAVGGIGAVASRIAVSERLEEAGYAIPTLIHPSAVVEPSAELATGVQVFPQAYVGSESRLGRDCIINTGTIVSHDCVLADYVNLSPGVILAGGVQIGAGVLVGMGVTINLNVHIGLKARIGNSAVVKEDVPNGALVRAGGIWPP
jgi:sugar O-acyltransferase (sialic acid O-acetyltransferase NeuD family)